MNDKTRIKGRYQELRNNINKGDAIEVCNDLVIEGEDDVKNFVDNILIYWKQGSMISTDDQLVNTARACKYVPIWCMYIDKKLTMRPNLDHWKEVFEAMSRSTVCAITSFSSQTYIAIRNGD